MDAADAGRCADDRPPGLSHPEDDRAPGRVPDELQLDVVGVATQAGTRFRPGFRLDLG
ncbi:MAG: hypothetical protein IPN02_18825 [Candidatus Microthrix sp.]|uniref:Uncharacterized protein n=1 Tax=Candidatus Neomicrothrix subdominans TaxID=2954438 RepID=A0A936NF45_9ACTN|nr:hypothetical protein [Candidatus Microthrix subdominans]